MILYKWRSSTPPRLADRVPRRARFHIFVYTVVTPALAQLAYCFCSTAMGSPLAQSGQSCSDIARCINGWSEAINAVLMFSRDSTISLFLSGLCNGDPARKPRIATDL